MKHKNHDKIASKNEAYKKKHLEKIASDLLKQDEDIQKLKKLKLKKDIFKLFK